MIEALLDPLWLKTFGRHLIQHFREDRSFESAAALSYTSLLALVPLMTVMLGVISGFPVFDHVAEELETYIFTNFVPAAGDVIREHLNEFVDRTTGLTGAGTVFLIATAILLMSTIERSLNRIWRVKASRGPTNRLMIYWAVLTLGPLLMGASLALTSYLAASSALAPHLVRGVVQEVFFYLMPFGVVLVAFTLIFILVPNRRVLWRHALFGALLSAILFELAKGGFVWYVTNFPTYERLYGALATIPLFLIWIYLSWVVILLGASVAAALTTFKYRKAGWRWNPRHEFVLAVRLLGHLWQAQRRGRSLSVGDLLSREPAATDLQLNRILGHFHTAGFIHADDFGDWMLSADLDEVTLEELYRAGSFIMPVGELADLPMESHWDRALIETLRPVDEASRPMLDCSVKSILKFNTGRRS